MSDSPRAKLARATSTWLLRRPIRVALTKPVVSFTFDDVPVSAAETGAAILEAHNARGTYYVSSSLIGCTNDYGEPIADGAAIAKLATAGHEIANHTFHHRRVGDLNHAKLQSDLQRNATTLANLTENRSTTNFAYPFNAPSLCAKHVLKKHARSARGGLPGLNRATADLSFLRANTITPSTDKSAALDPAHIELITQAATENAWLIFFTHEVRNNPSVHGVSPDILERLVKRCLAANLDIMTVDAALDRIGAPRSQLREAG
ncbi:MAG: polysaccharide deacetylase family protein [Pseudomonadota bacterium]